MTFNRVRQIVLIFDRIAIYLAVIWILALATALVVHYTVTLRVKGNVMDQIAQIYDWIERDFKPAVEDTNGTR